MADNVRAILEDMIPELEDMEKRGYFSKAEIKRIVQKRSDFEYRLKRKAAVKTDYLRYHHHCRSAFC
jgi:U3 small nucleolar RNA-associated protein 6